MEVLLTAAANLGVTATLVLFFAWQQYKRETITTERIHKLEEFQQRELLELVKQTTRVIESCATATVNGNTKLEEVVAATKEVVAATNQMREAIEQNVIHCQEILGNHVNRNGGSA